MLCECIDSILALSLQPGEREIIVVDDGSDVSPMNSLMQYGDNIIYIRQKNSGVSVARNTGLNMAKGDYIQLIDGDDYLLPKAYEQCLDLIRKLPETDMVLFDFTSQEGQKQAAATSPLHKLKKESGIDYMLHHNIKGSSCCYLFHHAIRGELLFTPGIQYGEDEEFTAQLMLNANWLIPTKEKAYYYRERKASAIHQNSQQKIDKRLQDTRTVLAHLQETCRQLSGNEQQALKRRIAQLTMDYIYNTILLTRSEEKLNQTLDDLHNDNLFPLPNLAYSTKYNWFRRMTQTRNGRFILLHLLPLLKKER
jgi:glycosyltransferase involved in cell wall biosynthesis